MDNFSIAGFSFGIIAKRKPVVLLVIFCSLGISAATARIPHSIGGCLSAENLSASILILSLCYLTRAVCKLCRNHFSASLGMDVVTALRMLCMDEYYAQKKEDKLQIYTLITYDIEKVAAFISQHTLVFIEDVIVLAITLATVSRQNLIVFFMLCAEVVIIVWLSLRYTDTANGLTARQREAIGEVTDVIYEATIVQKLIRSFDIGDHYISSFARANGSNTASDNAVAKCNRNYTVILEFILSASILFCISVAALDANASGAEVIVYYGYMTLVFNTAHSFSSVINLYIRSRQSLIRIRSMLCREREERQYHETDDENKIVCRRTDGKVYEFYRNEITCVRGRSGSGKSTLINSIAFGDNDFCSAAIPGNRAVPGISSQESIFLDGTVRKNISLGRSCPEAWERELYSRLFDEKITKKRFWMWLKSTVLRSFWEI